MSTFLVHSPDTAPAASKALLQGAQKQIGFIPNLFGIMAEAPATLKAYLDLSAQYDKTDLTGAERELVALVVSRVNDCEYCLAAHGTLAAMHKAAPEEIEAVKAGRGLTNLKRNALVRLAQSIAETRGRPAHAAVAAFHAQGYTAANYLEVLLGVTLLTLSNYVNNKADTPIDNEFGGAEKAA